MLQKEFRKLEVEYWGFLLSGIFGPDDGRYVECARKPCCENHIKRKNREGKGSSTRGDIARVRR